MILLICLNLFSFSPWELMDPEINRQWDPGTGNENEPHKTILLYFEREKTEL